MAERQPFKLCVVGSTPTGLTNSPNKKMKLITLNIWGGQIYKPLINFLKTNSDIDIFCLQEVFNNPPGIPSAVQTKTARLDIYSDIKKILSDHNGYINPAQDNEESQAIFVKKSVQFEKIEEFFVYRWKNAMENADPSTYGVLVQQLGFLLDGKVFTVFNLHGHWVPKHKLDNPARIEQSTNIKKVMNKIDGAKILCGDFNLEPETESMKILEKGMRNLVTENGIQSTRTSFYTWPVKFADYILVSPQVKVKNFEVLKDEVSDHSPLLLEFD